MVSEMLCHSVSKMLGVGRGYANDRQLLILVCALAVLLKGNHLHENQIVAPALFAHLGTCFQEKDAYLLHQRSLLNRAFYKIFLPSFCPNKAFDCPQLSTN